ncbi:MAG TPA: YfbM family protein [Gemmataceae bacterium]|nr:YfbM family protein [Gemmataceae bacterium]
MGKTPILVFGERLYAAFADGGGRKVLGDVRVSMTGRYRRLSPPELKRLKKEPSSIIDFLYPDDDSALPADCKLDIDKAWHAIQFLLTGDPWQGEPPLQNAVLGGTEIGEDEFGYGPVRYLTPCEVGEVAAGLSQVAESTLRSRFIPSAFSAAGIYPHGWQGSPDEWRYVAENYRRLVRFFQAAASAGQAMLLYLA